MTTTASMTGALAALLALCAAALGIAAFMITARIGRASAARSWEKRLRAAPVQSSPRATKEL